MKKILFPFFMAFFSFVLQAQNVAVVSFMKVPGNGQDAYLAIEKQWKSLHQNKVESGDILGWELFSVRGSGTLSPYNFVTVTIFDNFDKTETLYTETDFKKAFGNNMNDVLTKTGASRSLLYSEIYHLRVGISPVSPDKYIVVNSVQTDDLGKYINMEKVGFMPLHEQAIKMGKKNSWGIWTRWPNENNNLQAVAVDGYTKYSDINYMDYNAILENTIPGMKAGDLMDMMQQITRTNEIRTIVKSEIWELVDSTTPKSK